MLTCIIKKTHLLPLEFDLVFYIFVKSAFCLSMHTNLLSNFDLFNFFLVPHLFGYEANLAVRRCVRFGCTASRHGAKTCVRSATSIPSDRDGTFVL